ncbi:hypothetical protein [Kitasatospora sp. NPDC088134]|uniref:hypothetical protein n=1 Tax=Kitasatospora sp. NPDC088134 TaxID=3364071 RepID=UPI003828253B
MQVSALSLWGAGMFGAVIGWIAYRTLRRNTKATTLTDLVTVIAALGGGVVINTKFAEPDLFASYGIGLFAGFFGYFVVALLVDRAEERSRTEPLPVQPLAAQEPTAPSGAAIPAPSPEPVGVPRDRPGRWMNRRK